MKEKLGVAVEEGTTAQLRELAGGQRKIGAYLSGVVAWLWQHKVSLADLQDFDPAEVKQLRKEIEMLNHSYNMLSKMIVLTQNFGREAPAPSEQAMVDYLQHRDETE